MKSEFPENWVSVSFETIYENISISKLKIKEDEYLAEGLYPVIDQSSSKLVSGFSNDPSKLVNKAGTKIIFGDHTKAIKLFNDPFVPGADGIKVLNVNSAVLIKYAFYLLKSLNIPNKGYARHFSLLKSFSYPIAPYAEQIRIVQKIEELFSEIEDGIQSLETAKKQLDVYRHAILTAAFNGELTDKWRKKNPQLGLTTENLLNQLKDERKEHFEKQLINWENEIKVWAKNGSDFKKPRKPKSPSLDIKYCKNEKLGVSIPLYELHLQVFDGPFGSNLKTADYTESGIPVVRLENIQFLEFITDKQAFISHEKYEILKKHTVKPNDIIFSSFIGEQNRVALIPPSIPKAINKADCFCIRNLSKLIKEKFILYFLASRDAYKQIEDEVHGVGRQRINTTQLKNIYLPIVSIDEQREIIVIIEKAFESYSNLLPIIDSELKRLNNLKVSILQKAFSGQLVPHDPNDEPASVLLERIKAEKEEKLAKTKANKAPKKPTKRKTKTTKEDEPAQQELI